MVGQVVWNRPKLASFSAFQNTRELPKPVLEAASNLSSKKAVTKVREMRTLAQKSQAERDLENALIYHFRVASIGIPASRRDTTLRKDSAFMSMINESMVFMEEMHPVLESLYDVPHIINLDGPVPPATPKFRPLPKVVINHKERDVITAREIVSRVKGPPEATVLILDYRINTEEQVNYDDPQKIAVTRIPREVFGLHGLTFQSLINAIPMQERSNLSKLDSFDILVMMGDDTGEINNNNLVKLLESIETYNNNVRRPRHPAVLLKDGFEGWKRTYPTYTFAPGGRIVSRNYMAQGDALDEIIESYRQSRLSRDEVMMYPDLSPPKAQPPPRIPEEPPLPPLELPPSNGDQRWTTFGNDDFPPVFPTLPPASNDIRTPSSASASSSSVHTSFSGMSIGGGVGPVPTPRTTAPNGGGATLPGGGTAIPFTHSFPTYDRSTKPTDMPAYAGGAASAGGASVSTANGGVVPVAFVPAPATTPSAASTRPRVDRGSKPALVTPEDIARMKSVYSIIQKEVTINSPRGRERPGVTGLYNSGNTCFMNATLQALFHTDMLRAVFSEKNGGFESKINPSNKFGTGGVFTAGFVAVMDLLWSGHFNALRINRFISIFGSEVNNSLTDGCQHDAHEFQMFLLDALHEDTNMGQRRHFEQNFEGGASLKKNSAEYDERQRQYSNSPIQRIFNLRTVSELQCLTCNKTSATFEESSCLSLELPQNAGYSTSLSECLRQHFSTAQLDGDERWNCPKCQGPRRAKKTTALWTLPHVLVVHLKRFSCTGSGYVKNTMEVDFPREDLSLQPYFHTLANPGCAVPYRLYAVTNHTGTLTSGHYTSIVSIDGVGWTKADDESMSSFDGRNISPSGAFILFYKRVN